MEIAAESGLGTTLLGNLMVPNRPLATPAVLAIPISRLLLRGMRGLAGRMQRRVLWMTGSQQADVLLKEPIEISPRVARLPLQIADGHPAVDRSKRADAVINNP